MTAVEKAAGLIERTLRSRPVLPPDPFGGMIGTFGGMSARELAMTLNAAGLLADEDAVTLREDAAYARGHADALAALTSDETVEAVAREVAGEHPTDYDSVGPAAQRFTRGLATKVLTAAARAMGGQS